MGVQKTCDPSNSRDRAGKAKRRGERRKEKKSEKEPPPRPPYLGYSLQPRFVGLRVTKLRANFVEKYTVKLSSVSFRRTETDRTCGINSR